MTMQYLFGMNIRIVDWNHAEALLVDHENSPTATATDWPCDDALLGYLCMERCGWRIDTGRQLHSKALNLWNQCRQRQCKCSWSDLWRAYAERPTAGAAATAAAGSSINIQERSELHALALHWNAMLRDESPVLAARLGLQGSGREKRPRADHTLLAWISHEGRGSPVVVATQRLFCA